MFKDTAAAVSFFLWMTVVTAHFKLISGFYILICFIVVNL